VVDRNGTAADVRYCESPGTCVFHILNAFDLPDGRVAVDAVSYPHHVRQRPDWLDRR
jgi:carotenoid cleavage dioxygenase-like enzyme